MKKSFNNPFTNPDKAGQAVHKIVAQAVIFMLFFTVISCEKSEKIEFYPEVFSRKFVVFHSVTTGCFSLSGDDWISQQFSYEPINLPEKFQKDRILVNVTFRKATGNNREGRCGILIELITIEELIFTSRFVVSYHDDCGFLLFEDLGDENPMVFIPMSLPEEFQKEGLRVDVTFHNRGGFAGDGRLLRCGDHHPSSMKIITIMETPEKSLSAETRIEGDHDAAISDNPWQVFLTQTLSNNISPFKLSSL